MENTDVFDSDLNPVLEGSSSQDLSTLVDYISNKLSEKLTKHPAYKEHNPEHSEYADLLAKEIRDMGGNSFANIYRGEGPRYKEIVCDVAGKLKVPYNKKRSIEDIENSILETILSTTIKNMTNTEKGELLEEMQGKGGIRKGSISTAAFLHLFRAGGFNSYKLTAIIANKVSVAILGRALTFLGNQTLIKTVSILSGPVGWAITGAWTAVDIASPAYKVTIPCVIHIAMLRKKLNILNCQHCDAMLLDTNIKFCPECGGAISK